MKILIKNGTIVNPDKTFEADILLGDLKIIEIKKGIKEKADKIIDAKGKFVLPGLIDMHTHLRTPGREDEEDLLSGSSAAAKGGFTTICCMPNTDPCIDNEGVAQWLVEEAGKIGLVSVHPIGAITQGREGRNLSEYWALKNAGCLGLSDDGNSVEDSSLLKRAFEYAKMVSLPIISHCEDKSLSGEGVIRESFISSKYGLSPIPEITEAIRAFRDIQLAKYTAAKLHLAHISSAKTLELLRGEKKDFPLLSCETAPHYFVLTVEDVEKNNFDSNFKVNPSLGTKKDQETIKAALKEGVIDCIATDHAPHSVAEKELPFNEAPFGFIGMETAFSLSYTYLVKPKILDLKGLVQKLSSNPAKILNLNDRGILKENLRADLIIVDLSSSFSLNPDTIVSKSRNTPFLGWELEGTVDVTIHRGKIVYQR